MNVRFVRVKVQPEGVDAQGRQGSKVVGVAAVLGCIQHEDFCSTEHVRNEPTPTDRYMPQLKTNKKVFVPRHSKSAQLVHKSPSRNHLVKFSLRLYFLNSIYQSGGGMGETQSLFLLQKCSLQNPWSLPQEAERFGKDLGTKTFF